MYKSYLLAINFLLLAALCAYIFFDGKREKRGYILTQEVFNGFAGKQELEAKLNALKAQHKAWADSVATLVQNGDSENLLKIYDDNLANFQLQEQELSRVYTSDVWKQINHHLQQFGKENGYVFIFGAAGDGNLMYADDDHNITEDVISYINKKYKE